MHQTHELHMHTALKTRNLILHVCCSLILKFVWCSILISCICMVLLKQQTHTQASAITSEVCYMVKKVQLCSMKFTIVLT